MSQEKEKIVEVKTKDGDNEKIVKILVKRPTSSVASQSQRIAAKVWTDCVRDGFLGTWRRHIKTDMSCVHKYRGNIFWQRCLQNIKETDWDRDVL